MINYTEHVQQAIKDAQLPNECVFINIGIQYVFTGNAFVNLQHHKKTCDWRSFSSAPRALSVAAVVLS